MSATLQGERVWKGGGVVFHHKETHTSAFSAVLDESEEKEEGSGHVSSPLVRTRRRKDGALGQVLPVAFPGNM